MLTGSGSGLIASQNTDHGLKSHPTDWEKPGIEPANPLFTRHRLIPNTAATSVLKLK